MKAVVFKIDVPVKVRKGSINEPQSPLKGPIISPPTHHYSSTKHHFTTTLLMWQSCRDMAAIQNSVYLDKPA